MCGTGVGRPATWAVCGVKGKGVVFGAPFLPPRRAGSCVYEERARVGTAERLGVGRVTVATGEGWAGTRLGLGWASGGGAAAAVTWSSGAPHATAAARTAASATAMPKGVRRRLIKSATRKRCCDHPE